MKSNILDLLAIAKEEKDIGQYTFIALGRNKIPMSIKEGLNQLKFKDDN